MLVRKGLGEVLKPTGLVDQFHELLKQGLVTEVPRALRDQQFEWIVCPHQSIRSAWVVKKLKSNTKIGFQEWWNGPFFNVRVHRPKQIPDALRQLALVSPLDPEVRELIAKAVTDFAPGTELFRSWGDEKSRWSIPDVASMSVSIEGPAPGKNAPIALAPGSVWATKKWPWEKYAELAQRLVASGNRVVLIGGREEAAVGIEIQNLAPQVENWIGKTSLVELWDRLASCRALVCNDSGPMHMASALSLPTVSVFGPTTLDLGYRPWQNSVRVVQIPLSCRPCGTHGAKSCPIGTHECMKGISVDQVEKNLRDLISG